IVQDALIRIYKSISNGQYKEEGRFLYWALRLTYNIALDYLKRYTPIIIPHDHPKIKALPAQEECSGNKIVQKQRRHYITDLLYHLPEEQRQVIISRHLFDMNYKEIAFLMNTSVNTATGRMRYGLINLREIMKQKQLSPSNYFLHL
ncbi:MAG: sigma-70 family RNA polymerase sigma factor, partial [Flavisolibacter sp.]|nr:sigma-70 family RNA polymerase sigma factor [Flavisolibacter sp.]